MVIINIEDVIIIEDILLDIERVNELLNQGSSYNAAIDSIGIKRTTFRDRIKKNGFTYDSNLKLIVEVSNNSSSSEDSVTTQNKKNNDIKNLSTEEIKDISKNSPIFTKEILNKINEMYGFYVKEKGRVSLNIDKTRFEERYLIRTIKIYDNVANGLEVILKKYPEYSKQDIINTAILDFIEKVSIKDDNDLEIKEKAD